jgi:predicted MPP superfamily phosphohydrolase
MVKFQYISDLHLEHYKNLNSIIGTRFQKLDDCENLFLLGDIGYAYSDIYHEFINYCASNWLNVFVVFGNHEYYCKTDNIKTMEEIEKEVSKFRKNVYFLNNDYVLINKKDNTVKKLLDREDHSDDYIKIIGSTLWCNITDTASARMNDYNFIYTTPTKNLTPQETRSFFRMNKEYIIQELQFDNFESILLTHHGVNNLCNGPYMGNIMESGYATDIKELSNFTNLIACINGHTHVHLDTVIPGTNIKLLSNCYGYKGENQNIVKFNKDVILDV